MCSSALARLAAEQVADRRGRRPRARGGRAAPSSTCRASRARRWTASRSAPPTRPATLPVVARDRGGPSVVAPARRRARRWGSRPAASSRRARTPSSRSSTSPTRARRSSCRNAVATGDNVRPRGGDVVAGATVLEAGTRALTPSRLAALAAAGVATPRVRAAAPCRDRRDRHRAPPAGRAARRRRDLRVERADARGAPRRGGRGGRACSAASPTTRPRTRPRSRAGSRPTCSSRRAASRSARTTSSAATIAKLGAEEVFWGVAMRPGKPLSFAVRGDTLVFGLPGNPVSSLVGTLLFVQPAIRALQGARDPGARFALGVLGAPARRGPRRDDYQRARLEVVDDDRPVLHPVRGQESHMIVRAAAADALVHIPRGDGELPRRRARSLPAARPADRRVAAGRDRADERRDRAPRGERERRRPGDDARSWRATRRRAASGRRARAARRATTSASAGPISPSPKTTSVTHPGARRSCGSQSHA